MKTRYRLIAAIGAGAVLVSGGAAVASAAAGVPVTGGSVSVAMNGTTVKSIAGAGLAFYAIAPATKRNGVLRLPNSSGTANPPNFLTHQAGGFKFIKHGKAVKVTNIVFNTAKKQATADVTNHGNIVLFVLGMPNSGSGGPGRITYGGYSVTFAPAAIRAFDRALTTAVFARHPKFGTGTVTVLFKP